MERLRTVVRIAGAGGVAVGALLANQESSWLTSFSLPEWFPPIVALAIIFFFAEVIRETAEWLVGNLQFLRRLLLGRAFVEGTWIDVAYIDDRPVAAGIVRIEPASLGLRLSGEVFDLDGRPNGSFRSELADLFWPTLCYKYSAVRSESPTHDDFQGYSEIQFAERDGKSMRYQGYYCDLFQGRRIDVVGARLSEQEDEELTGGTSAPRDRLLQALRNHQLLEVSISSSSEPEAVLTDNVLSLPGTHGRGASNPTDRANV